MSTFGVHLTLLIGPTVPVPAPLMLTENLDRVEINQSDAGRSGFQIVFRAGRCGPLGAFDYLLLGSPLLRPGNRVVIMVVINAMPRVLMDGFIEHQQLNPGNGAGSGILTVTGQDISSALDREEIVAEHPAQNEMIIALKLIGMYAQYGLVPQVLPPLSIDFPIPVERIPVQRSTDLQYLQLLATRCGYVFYIRPGPLPLMNTAYWGPPIRLGLPAKALSVNLGPDSNIDSLDFEYNAAAPELVTGRIRDRNLNSDLPVVTFASTRVPPLAALPALLTNLPIVRKVRLENAQALNYAQAFARAQARTDASTDAVVSASGEVDATRYADVLEARGLVGVRGVGYSHDGLYYIKSVKHTISHGAYKQQFTLTREGLGSTVPMVRP